MKRYIFFAACIAVTVCAALTLRYSMESSATNVIYTFETKASSGPDADGSAEAGSGSEGFEISIGVSPEDIGALKPSEASSDENQTGAAVSVSLDAAETAAAAIEQTASAADSSSDTAVKTKNGYSDKAEIGLNSEWKYADYSVINSGKAVMYTAKANRRDKIVAVNAGHGTSGGANAKTYCHPDKTAKVTGGSTAAGAVKATAVSGGMTFNDGTPESKVTLRMAQILKDKLLASGYDVLMIRDGEDVQLDNIARTVISNNTADIHIALHWDGDGLDTIKGVFYMSVPDALKSMEPVASHWQDHEALGDRLIEGLKAQGIKVWGSNPLDMDLTQTSYSTIPSVDIELGNQCSDHSDDTLSKEADGLLSGINAFFGF